MATPAPVFTGLLLSDGIIAGNQTISNSHRSGGSSKIIYEGTAQRCVQEYLYFFAAGYDVVLTGGKAVWQLEATLNRDVINNPASDPVPEDIWELHRNEGQQSLLECTDRPTIALLTTAGKEAIESQLKNPLNMATANYNGPNKAAVTSVYNLMRLGVESRPTNFPTLKRTVKVSSNYNLSWTLANVGKILTTPTLIATYNIPANKAKLLPSTSDPVTDVNGITTFDGWYEYYPDDVSEPNNKSQISQAWQFNTRWSAIEYDRI